MKASKLKKIIKHNDYYREQIARECYMFYKNIGRQTPTVIPDIQTVAEIIFADKGYKLLHIPMESKEIGAFQLKLNGFNYLVLNTAKNMAYNNFSVAHELYHILIQEECTNRWDIYKDEYSDDEHEMMANAFAGNVMMPEEDFVLTYENIRKNLVNLKNAERTEYFDKYFIITMLMNYFRTTYMSVVVRCFETGRFDIKDEALVENLLVNNNKKALSNICEKYALYVKMNSIMEISYLDDFKQLLVEAEAEGKEKIKQGLLSQEDLEYKLDGMRRAYMEVVKAECQHGKQ